MILLRPATVDDAAELAAVQVRTWQAAYAHALPAAYLDSLDLPSRVERWRDILRSRIHPVQTYVAELDGGFAGFTSVGPYRSDPAVGEVYAIYVNPRSWSTGVGRALMDTGVTHLVAAHFTEIRLWVLEDNPRARGFYERRGFATDGSATTDTIGEGPHATDIREVRYARTFRRR